MFPIPPSASKTQEPPPPFLTTSGHRNRRQPNRHPLIPFLLPLLSFLSRLAPVPSSLCFTTTTRPSLILLSLPLPFPSASTQDPPRHQQATACLTLFSPPPQQLSPPAATLFSFPFFSLFLYPFRRPHLCDPP
ncbi:uncharacterized protein DS421_16g544740 [Arachis hypogaea]|nr:uncharacterized protein DS421_16g544740 [Arachis hypogaea]